MKEIGRIKTMPIYHYTEKNATQLLATKSRRIDISPYELSQIHMEIGKFISYELINEIDLEEYEINHPQGIKIGKRISNEKSIIILTFMRAGVYFGEGIRSIFQNAPFYFIAPERGIGFSDIELSKLPSFRDKIVILVDSVINTGGTMFAVIEQIKEQNPKKILVACSVIPDTTVDIISEKYPEIFFYIFRVSTNKYVGKGKTDTGNRLFGTF